MRTTDNVDVRRRAIVSSLVVAFVALAGYDATPAGAPANSVTSPASPPAAQPDSATPPPDGFSWG